MSNGAAEIITVTMQNGKLEIDKRIAHAKQGDEVRWQIAGSFQFGIDFGNNCPLVGGPKYSGSQGNPIVAKVLRNAQPNQYYKYSAAASDMQSIDVEDPGLIVDP